MTPDPDVWFGPYRVVKQLGAGAMGAVFKVWHPALNRHEALKLLLPELAAQQPKAVERFLREAATAGGLDHDNIVPIYAVSGQHDPLHYFTMQCVEGDSLAGLLRRAGCLPLQDSIAILLQVASALDYAHARGVIHRDVKPANILVARDHSGRQIAKVSDFGIARCLSLPAHTTLTVAGSILGTPVYMAPEQAGLGGPVDYRADIYSLGIVAYEMLCGRPPFVASSDDSLLNVLIAHATQPVPSPVLFNPRIPGVAVDAILRALSKRPDERFQSCEEFVRALSGARAAPWAGVVPHPMPGPLPTSSLAPLGPDDPTIASAPRRSAPARTGGQTTIGPNPPAGFHRWILAGIAALAVAMGLILGIPALVASLFTPTGTNPVNITSPLPAHNETSSLVSKKRQGPGSSPSGIRSAHSAESPTKTAGSSQDPLGGTTSVVSAKRREVRNAYARGSHAGASHTRHEAGLPPTPPAPREAGLPPTPPAPHEANLPPDPSGGHEAGLPP